MFERVCRIEYADMAKMNKIRAVARKYNARVEVQRYAKDAYEGRVALPYVWDRGVIEDDAIIAKLRAVIDSK